jgi:hypothetical protein
VTVPKRKRQHVILDSAFSKATVLQFRLFSDGRRTGRPAEKKYKNNCKGNLFRLEAWVCQEGGGHYKNLGMVRKSNLIVNNPGFAPSLCPPGASRRFPHTQAMGNMSNNWQVWWHQLALPPFRPKAMSIRKRVGSDAPIVFLPWVTKFAKHHTLHKAL